MKLLPSLFSCVYSRVKLFTMNSRRGYSIFVCFIYGLKERNSKSDVIFAVCRLPLTSCLTPLLLHLFFRSNQDQVNISSLLLNRSLVIDVKGIRLFIKIILEIIQNYVRSFTFKSSWDTRHMVLYSRAYFSQLWKMVKMAVV